MGMGAEEADKYNKKITQNGVDSTVLQIAELNTAIQYFSHVRLRTVGEGRIEKGTKFSIMAHISVETIVFSAPEMKNDTPDAG